MARLLLENVQFFRLPSDKLPPETVDTQGTTIAADIANTAEQADLTNRPDQSKEPAFSASGSPLNS